MGVIRNAASQPVEVDLRRAERKPCTSRHPSYPMLRCVFTLPHRMHFDSFFNRMWFE